MSPQPPIPTLLTSRLVLRAPRVEDFPAFADFLASERTHYMGGPVADHMQASRAFGNLAGLWVLRGYGMFVLERRDTGEPVGHAGARHPMPWPELELGWCLWSAAGEGEGFMTEAMRQIHGWVFDGLGWETCVSYMGARNARSAALARRMGAVIDPDAARPEGDNRDDVTVWRHRKGGLE
ncbi:GNAT family N-acetyltransferase [Tropicimonas isoalkanivorans]|uniref:Protein N-acetyltransferase, RimJ/RimL family n=1 Tax=Tropicimonas isoalkanivorans TaxID=441112 RepID=A0A1I1JRV0_9RHOB|nr:GNAT family N-acetyltransferase [Tropicimonas isoalkanivorans]SFC50951.1 Protein N-acetyltransferase, RimJ/RimL family [Tropicimonas isoalkanivorans]